MHKRDYRLVGVAVAILLVPLLLPAEPATAQEITYTFSGVVRVLDLSSPPPGGGTPIPGTDPLGIDGAAILLVCTIDAATAASFTGPNNDGTFAFYNAGMATLAITGSAAGDKDGTYLNVPCSVRVDDYPVGSAFGGDKLSLTTHWNLGLPFPDEFQVSFAELGQDTFNGAGLQPFAATEVVQFVGVNFSGSNDVFYFDSGFGIANGLLPPPDPAERIDALIDAVDALPGLTGGQRRSLELKLLLTLQFLEENRIRPVMALLAAFSRQLQRLVDRGRVAPADAQPLIEEANTIIEQLQQ